MRKERDKFIKKRQNIKKIVIALITIIITVVMASIIAGCGQKEVVAVNVESGNTSINNSVLGRSALIEIGGYLYYDSTTGIVYWWNGVFDNCSHSPTAPTPYYSSNGLLYRYIPETNTFEEIRNGE